MKVVDVHNHLYPSEYLEYLEGRTDSPIKVERTGPTHWIIYYKGIPLGHMSKPGHFEPEARIKDIDEYGIDVQILTLPAPGVEHLPASDGVEWARRVNDRLAEICRNYKGRFYAGASLPYQDVDAALKELERAKKDLDVRGIMMFSNIAGKPIYAPELMPIYEMAEAYELPIFVHPAPPVTTDAIREMHLPLPLFAFIMDTSMAVCGLIFHGVLEKFPRLKIIHAHLGGVFPYMVGRIDDCYKSYEKEFNYSIPEPPSVYYKRQVYVDAISFHLPAMKCALDYLGPERMVIGTDYAHPIGGPERVTGFVKALGLPEADLEKILWGNAARLYKLDGAR